jgi:hypothetical protein
MALGGVRLLIGASVTATLSAGCGSDVQAGTQLQLVSAPAALAAGQQLATAAGGVVRVDELYWTSAEVELLGCPDAWQRAVRFVLPEANAHGSSSPTLMATPTIESALTAVDVELAEMSPPAGRYCTVRYRLAPADRDAVGIDAAPDMLGSSFHLRGGVGPSPATLTRFEIVSEQAFDLAFDVALTLSATERTATLRFEHDPERWFGALDIATLTGDTSERAVLESFQAAIRLRVE